MSCSTSPLSLRFLIICLRDGPNAVDHQLRDLPSVGEEHRQRLRSRSQLDLQHPSVSHLPTPGSVLHLLWLVFGLQTLNISFFCGGGEKYGR